MVFQWLRHCFSNSRGTGLTLVRELRSHMPHGPKTKTENRSNVVTNSIKTLKMVHIKKLFKNNFLIIPAFGCHLTGLKTILHIFIDHFVFLFYT